MRLFLKEAHDKGNVFTKLSDCYNCQNTANLLPEQTVFVFMSVLQNDLPIFTAPGLRKIHIMLQPCQALLRIKRCKRSTAVCYSPAEIQNAAMSGESTRF